MAIVRDAAYYREWARANPDKVRANQQKYRQSHPDRVKEAGRRYRDANKDKVAAATKRWQRENAAAINEKIRLRKYGLTPDEYAGLLAAQAGTCAICTEPMDPPHVDHDHTTGKVRGLLCGGCNTGIGMLGDSPKRVAAALAYLEREAR